MSLYLEHFGLHCEPFSIVPDPGFLYPSDHHRQAVAHLKYGLDREGGFILLSGEVGTGKTTLTRTLLKHLPPHVRVAYVLNSKLQVTDVLASICDELAIEVPSTADLSFSKSCIDALNHSLIAAHGEGKKTLVVIEEAQNLSVEVLETLRLLSNLETTTHKLLHILLVGQPELLEILAQKDQRQLNQRVVSRFHLLPLAKQEVANYINHRLHHAGAKRAIFESRAITVLFRLTKGVPRLINLISHQALLAAYATGSSRVTHRLVKNAAQEILGDQNNSPNSGRGGWQLGLLSLAAIIFSLWLSHENGLLPINKPNSNPAADTVIAPSTQSEVLQSPPPPVPVGEELSTNPLENNAEQLAVDKPSYPLSALLAAWSLSVGPLYSEEEVVALAARRGLRAEKLTGVEWEVLQAIDRPAVVWLRDKNADLKSYLLESIDDNMLSLVGISGPQALDLQAFLDQWSGVLLYLWRPPTEFNSLRLGDTNPPGLSWLQAKLQQVDASYEQIITGGRYNPAIRDQVVRFQTQQGIKADGVVGPQTLMRINQLTDSSIPRLSQGDQIFESNSQGWRYDDSNGWVQR